MFNWSIDTQIIILKYAVLFGFTFFFSLLLNRILLRFSKNLGKRNYNESLVRWANESKPSLGGISFFIIFLVTYSIYTIFFNFENNFLTFQYLGIMGATGMGFLMGLSDDAYNTNPALKLSTQIFCGIILSATGTYISLFPVDLLNYALTILWVVAVMNSINMLDNMDGITTIVSIFIILMASVALFYSPDFAHFYLALLLGTLSSLIGFLFFNWNPAKMFMGDTGSQFLGIFLASIGIIFFWNNKGLGGEEASAKQICIVLLAFIIPISDTLTVIINRLRRGQAPYIGGKDHTTHHLSYLGLSDRNVAFLFIGISLLSYIFVWIIVKYLQPWNHLFTAIFILYFLIVFGFLFGVTQNRKAKMKFYEQERKRHQTSIKKI